MDNKEKGVTAFLRLALKIASYARKFAKSFDSQDARMKSPNTEHCTKNTSENNHGIIFFPKKHKPSGRVGNEGGDLSKRTFMVFPVKYEMLTWKASLCRNWKPLSALRSFS